jgi:uncharacterized membrane protein YphA (DoxX/SURF4 family)
MLFAIFFHFWSIFATLLIIGGDAQTLVAVLGMLLISFLIMLLLSFHLYASIYGNSNFNNFKGRKKQNDYVLKRTNQRTLSINTKRTKNKR